MTPGAFRYFVWLPLLRRSGVRYRKSHALRHTFASGLIQAGEGLASVKGQLGRHSIKITVDVYGHLVPGMNEAVVDRLDDATGHNPRATDIRSGLRVVQGGQR
jgi:integrase